MGFQLSPGVNVTETDLTTIIPAVATTAAAFAGKFQWGPVDEITLITKENQLRTVFGGPIDANAIDWFVAASFLSYGNNLQVVRTQGAGMVNASVDDSTDGLIKNEEDYVNHTSTVLAEFGEFIAKYPGELGNALSVVIIDSDDGAGTALDANRAGFLAEFDAAPGTSDRAESITEIGRAHV